ncbi:PA2779 family protein [Marinobacterium mangrovicola]|uniref:PA2779 family protein n=1 Tax=Marinobacterium mangrovicola TaxID=1476959 RepID=A0A4R1GV69_9GAMM|nr:PA2779 family protein [Marinobacterium mangrovicola]TCK08212.1 hypothetical protein CLV83_0286 [Marinobacterium mangrovicola]
MTNQPTRSRFLAWILMALFTFAGVQVPASAAIVTTDQISADSHLEDRRSEIQQMLMRDDVKQQLVDLGVDVNQVQDRVDSMTASELAQLDGKMDDLPAGGILGAVLAVILILVLLDLLGATDVFPNI